MTPHEQLYAHLPPAVAQACYDYARLHKRRTPDELPVYVAAENLKKLHKAYAIAPQWRAFDENATLRRWWRSVVRMRVADEALETETEQGCLATALAIAPEHPEWEIALPWDPWENDPVAQLALGELRLLAHFDVKRGRSVGEKFPSGPTYLERDIIAKHAMFDRLLLRLPEIVDLFEVNGSMRGYCRNEILVECLHNALDEEFGEESGEAIMARIDRCASAEPDWGPKLDEYNAAVARIAKYSAP